MIIETQIYKQRPCAMKWQIASVHIASVETHTQKTDNDRIFQPTHSIIYACVLPAHSTRFLNWSVSCVMVTYFAKRTPYKIIFKHTTTKDGSGQ